METDKNQYFDKEINILKDCTTDIYEEDSLNHLCSYFRAEMGDEEGYAYYRKYSINMCNLINRRKKQKRAKKKRE